MQIDTFLARWRNAGGSERANYQLFIADLCALLPALGRAKQSDGGWVR